MKICTAIFLFFLIGFTSLFGQVSNVFLNRDFWKSNPSVTEIDKQISLGNDVSELNKFAFDGMSYALIEKVNDNTLKHVLKQPGNGVNKLTHDGRTYMFWAAYKGNLEMMKYLVSHGAKTDVIDSHGYTIANFAARSGIQDVNLYAFLANYGANFIEDKNHDGANALLLVSPSVNDFKIIEYFVSQGVFIGSVDDNGSGIFSYAAKGGNVNILQRLIDKGLPYNLEDKNGDNAILFASKGNRGRNTIATYKYLKDKEIAVDIVNEKGRNPLHNIAYTNESLDVFKFFINHNVDVSLHDDFGRSPFMNAAQRNTSEVVAFLSKYVENINAKDEHGKTALALAVSENSISVINTLLKLGADINTYDAYGNTLAYYLLNNYKSNSVDVFEEKLSVLTSNGLVVNLPQSNGNTLLHIATKRNDLELLKRLEDFKIDVNLKNEEGMTALQFAAMKATDINILKYLLDKGADKSVVTEFDETIYDLAKENELLRHENTDINFLK